MTDELKRIAAKLRKIMDKANSAEQIGNAEEAATFTAKAQELLTRYQLTMSDVEYAAQDDDDPLGKEYHNASSGYRRVAWMQDLGSAVARAFFCRILVYPGSTGLAFVGRQSHREAAIYVYGRLVREVLRLQDEGYDAIWRETRDKLKHDVPKAEWVRAARAAQYGFKAAFRNAFVHTVRRRLREQEKLHQQEAEASASTDNGMALIRLDTAHKAADRWLKENIKTSSCSGLNGQWSGNTAGRRAGAQAGMNANLSANGVQRGGQGPARIGSGK